MAEVGTVETPDSARIAKLAKVPRLTGGGPVAMVPLEMACV